MIVAGIPAYNEEKTIAKVVLLAQRHVDVVIVCDDGSQDMTADIAQKLGATVIRHNKNMGYGLALQSLFKKANMLNADILLTLDGDGQHDAREMPKLIRPIVDNKADIVIGSRFLEESGDIPSYRRLGIRLLTRFTNGGGKDSSTDAQSGFRAYDRLALQKITIIEGGMGASAEILLNAKSEGLRIAEVPVQAFYKDLDTSTQNPVSHGLSVLSTIIRLLVEERPLFYLGLPSIALLIVGGFFGLWTLQTYAREGYVVTNIALASLAFGLIGIFTLFTSITLYAILRLSQKAASNKSD